MDCFRPIALSDRTVPCGRCIPCLKRRQDGWSVRLQQELDVSSSCLFVTLTYKDDFVPTFNGKNVLYKRHCQLWMKSLRKAIYPHKIRYFLCGEYGPKTLRPHYHALIFNFPKGYDAYTEIHKAWKRGYTVVAPVTPSRISYVAKYCAMSQSLPRFYRHKSRRPFVLCSRHPAIGANYLSDSIVSYHRETLSTLLITRDGIKHSLPKYYRDRIFDDQMKYDISIRTDAVREKNIREHVLKYPAGYIDDQRSDFTRVFKTNFNKRKL